MPVIKPFVPYLIGAAVIVAMGVGVKWYGSSRYDAGYEQAGVDIRLASEAATRAAQEDKNRAEAEYRGAVLAREQKLATLDASVARLNRVLDTRANRPTTPGTPGRVDGTGTAGNVVLRECVREYRAMGEHAGRLADKVNGWQGYAGAVLPRWGIGN